MRKVGISVLLFLSAVAYGQTINPNQIRPATTNGYVLTTVGGATVWAPGGSSGGCTPISNGGHCVTDNPTVNQEIVQPSNTIFTVDNTGTGLIGFTTIGGPINMTTSTGGMNLTTGVSILSLASQGGLTFANNDSSVGMTFSNQGNKPMSFSETGSDIDFASSGAINLTASTHVGFASGDITPPVSGSVPICVNSSGVWGTFSCGGSVTWPASTDLVVSNSTNSPAGLAPVNGDCVVGSGGAWVAGSCAGTGSGTNVSVNGGSSLSAANFNATTPAAPTNGINATWQISGSTVSAAIVGDGNAAHFLNGTGAFSAPSGSGTVTSVSFTGGLISVATATTTPALTVAGTSGGIPYFSGAATWASSAALPSGDFVLGGGAGSAPTASFSIVTAAKGGTGIANTATLTLGTSNQNWATLGTGIVKNTTTTGAITDATSADVIGLWTGTCSSSTFLRGDGACAAASGSSGISGLTAGFLPIAGSSTTLTANSHIDDGVTTAATLTASEPLAVTGAPGIIMAHATATPGVVGSVVYTVDATTGFGEMNQNNLGLERIAGWNTANTFTANQTAPSFIASGSGAGSVVLTNGTAPSAVASSVQLIPPATVTTAYNYIFPAGPLNSANPVLEQCTGTATTLSCAPASGSVSTALVTGTYSDVSFNNSHVATAHIGLEADSSGTDKSLYEDVPTGGVFNFRVNSVSGIEAGVASGNYWAIEWGAAPTAAHPSIQADISGTDPAFYLVAGTGGQVQMKSASLPLATFVPGSAPTGACSGNYFTFSATDGKGTYCNGTTQVNKF